MRRLPIYFLINNSTSICNETFENFKDCIKLLIETLLDDEEALETAHISIITFDNTITRLCPLSPLSSVKVPTIRKSDQKSSLDQALLQFTTIINNEFINSTCEKLGDWKPLIFVFTDNDSVINIAREEIKQLYHTGGRIIVCTPHDSVDSYNYKLITEIILPIESLDKFTLHSQIYWLYDSIGAVEVDDYYEQGIPPFIPPPCIDIDLEPNYTYEPVCDYTVISDKTRENEIKTLYERTIGCLTYAQEQYSLFRIQIDELKKKNNEIQLKDSSCSSSYESKEKHLECDKELNFKMSQAQMCERYIGRFIQQKSNLEKKLATLEEQNKYNDVYSSIFTPAEIRRKSNMQVQVYLHLYEESEKVKSLARESDKNAERRDYIPLLLKLGKGDKVDIEFNVYGENRLMSERKSVIWQGSFTKCSFNYFVPKDIEVDELSCEANLFVNGVMIGEMRFLTHIVEVPRNLNPEILTHRYNKIFISYAHQDSVQANMFALAYKAQGVEYFYDRDSLAPGDVYEEKIFDYIDSSDLFILCWSKNAAVSDYVAKEKERALLRAYPQLSHRDATLKICPISIEPRADLPSDMKDIYNFEVI